MYLLSFFLVFSLYCSGGEKPLPEREKIKGAVIKVPGDQGTIQKAVDAANDGDTVLIAPGTYEGGVTIEGKSVVIASFFLTTGDKSYISKTVLQGKKGGTINVKETAGPDTKIIGLTVDGGNDGINCRARIHILNNIIMRTTDGIDYEGSGISGGICRYNVFERNGDDGIDIDNACDVIIEKNIIRNNKDDGIEFRFHKYTGKDMLNVVIRENIIKGNGEDGIQLIHHDGPIKRVARIERNIISDTRMSAIGCMCKGKTREDYKAAEIPDRVYIINNTFLDNNYGLTGGGNLIVLNNIFAGTKNIAVKGTGEPAVVAYNIFWKNGTDHEQSNIIKEHTLYKDPGLDTNGKLIKTSPCIDAGVSEFYWRNEKVLEMAETLFSGKSPDLGAVEFGQ